MYRRCLYLCFFSILLCVVNFNQLAYADEGKNIDFNKVIKSRIPNIIRMAKSPEVIEALQNHNKKQLSMERVHKRDREWVASGEDDPLKKVMMKKNISQFLKKKVVRKRYFSEIFLIDRRGATVAAFPLTSDYWQGDEEKFTKPFQTGENHIGVPEYDESSKAHATQVGVPVLDKRERIIGVLVVGVLTSYVKARSQGF